MTLHACLALLLIVCPLAAVMAQETENQQEEQKRPDLVQRVFRINYADINSIHRIVAALTSRYGRTSIDRVTKTLVVQDSQDYLDNIGRRIAELDIPPDRIRLTFFAFKAMRSGIDRGREDVPPGVNEALEELVKLMSYRSFELIDSGLLTLLSTGERGSLQISDQITIEFHYDYNQESKFLRLENLGVYLRADDTLKKLFQTTIPISKDEVVVAGASKLNGGEEALLIVVMMNTTTITN